MLIIDSVDFTEYLLPSKVEIHYDLKDNLFSKTIGVELRVEDGLFERIYKIISGRDNVMVQYTGPWWGAEIHDLCEVSIMARHKGIHKLWIDYRDKR